MVNWDNPPKSDPPHPSIILGDFNSHHSEWGYKTNNTSGNEVSQWASQSDLTLIYNPKDKGTLKSARWNKEFTPDLVFVTKDNTKKALPTTREVLEDFPIANIDQYLYE